MENAIIDPNYEFEAPHFVNFSSVDDDEDAYADAWFGKVEIIFTRNKTTFYFENAERFSLF